MLNRRAFLCGSIATVLGLPLVTEAQQTGKAFRIGYLNPGPPSVRSRSWDAFLQGLREHGLLEGQNVVIDRRYASGEGADRVSALLTDLVAARPDVIVTVTTTVALIAKGTVNHIPIVMAVSTDPVGASVVESLARPGGNVTGFALTGPDLTAKRLELLKAVAPQTSRVVLMTSSSHPVYELYMKEARAAGPALGIIEVEQLDIGTDPASWPSAFEPLGKSQSTGLLIAESPALVRHAAAISELTVKHKLPSIYGLRAHVEQGGLMSYGADVADLFYRTAAVVHQVLNGVNPGTIPVEQPNKYELFVNLKTVRALGLTIPSSLLLRADRVIE